MKERKFLCPLCGSIASGEYDNKCYQCYSKNLFTLDLPNVIHITICKECNSFLYKNRWEKFINIEDIFLKSILPVIKKKN